MNTSIQHTGINVLKSLHPNAEILSTGIYLPRQRVKSDDLLQEIDSYNQYNIPQDWISSKVGIIERRYAEDGETPSSMAVKAAERAIAYQPDINPDHIDKIVFCGIDKDQAEPATAHNINQALGLSANEVYDITDACYGFIRGMQDCARSIKLGETRLALVATGELPSRVVKYYLERMRKGVDKSLAKKWLGFVTAGDAAGAVIMGKADALRGNGFQTFSSLVNSRHRDKCYYKHMSDGEIQGQMLMAHINAHGKKLAQSVVASVANSPDWETPDYLLTHQTGNGTFNILADFELVPRNRMIRTYNYLGNITTATFPVNYHHLLHDIGVGEGTKVSLLFSGSGLVFGHGLYVV